MGEITVHFHFLLCLGECGGWAQYDGIFYDIYIFIYYNALLNRRRIDWLTPSLHSARNCLTFVKTTVTGIANGQKPFPEPQDFGAMQ